MEKLRIIKIADGFLGCVGNKEYKAPTRQGVIDAWMAQHVMIEDEPVRDYVELLSRIEYIMKARPSKSLTELFCHTQEMYESTWHDDNSFLAFVEKDNGITPYVPEVVKEHDHENLTDVLIALGFRDHASFEVLAYVPDQDDAYWILRMEDFFYYIASIQRNEYNDDSDNNVYYDRVQERARVVLSAVAYAPLFGNYDNAPIAVNMNLAYQVLGKQAIGVVDHTLTGYEK